MSLMTNDDIKLFPHDPYIGRMFGFIPRWIKPNHLTSLRIILIPIIVLLLLSSSWVWAFSVFLFAALTDILDGTLARTRAQITLWGTIADPVADKLLISTLLIYLILTGLPVWVGLLVIGFELIVILGALRLQIRGVYSSANLYGKIKMSLQVMGMVLLFLEKLSPHMWYQPLALVLFCLSAVFALISFFTYGF